MNPLWLPFAGAFRLGAGLRRAGYETGLFKTRRLAKPVVSVGNLTVGGTGKTPLVVYIAQILLRQGWKPAILTRGYGRRDEQEIIAVSPDAESRDDPREIGDEPAVLARLLPGVPMVVCADRFRAGQAAEERFGIDVHVLDDGFQHWALERDLDVVTLDATQEISNWAVLPAGRQRESLSALRRAEIIVITRTESADPKPLQNLVLKVHPAANVFLSRTNLLGWRDAMSGERVAPPEISPAGFAAFCGIGNPRVFFGNLRRWGFSLTAEDAFPDHHVYTGREIQGLASRAREKGATALLTTEKDAVKLRKEWSPGLPILACKIASEILEAGSFEGILLDYLEKAR